MDDDGMEYSRAVVRAYAVIICFALALAYAVEACRAS